MPYILLCFYSFPHNVFSFTGTIALASRFILDHDEIKPLFQEQSQEKENELENVLPALVEQLVEKKELENLTENLKLQVKKVERQKGRLYYFFLNHQILNYIELQLVYFTCQNPTKPNLTDRLFFKPAVTAVSGSFPLDTVFFLLLTHTCGGNLHTHEIRIIMFFTTV